MKDDSTAQKRSREAPPVISAEDVVAYLSAHPDFFRRHEQALIDLELPHQIGRAHV